MTPVRICWSSQSEPSPPTCVPADLEDSDSYKVPHYAEKARMTPLFYAYVQQAHAGGFSVLWSDWLAAREAEDPAA